MNNQSRRELQENTWTTVQAVKTTKSINNVRQFAKTTKFKSQLGRDYNEPQTAVPSEPGGAYSTPAPSNGSLTEQNSPKQPQTS